MNNKEILDIFYREFIVEARLGRVDCFRMYNIAFSTKINDNYYNFIDEARFNGIMVPVLNINDELLFNSLLCEYIKIAYEFYDKSNYYEEVRNDDHLIIKTLMCSLFANATAMDFSNPINFLNTRIKMFNSRILNSDEEELIGHSDILKGSIYLTEKKASINDETPYEIEGRIVSDEDPGKEFYIPTIRLSKIDDELFIYAIQSRDKIDKEDEYSKSIYDVLKHIDKGFTLSFIVSAILGISLSDCSRVNVIPLLITRWNSKCIMNRYKIERYGDSIYYADELYGKQESIQNNLTDKFIRIFSRLEKHCKGIELESYLEYEDNRYILNVDRNIDSNREIVNELFQIGYNYIENVYKNNY